MILCVCGISYNKLYCTMPLICILKLEHFLKDIYIYIFTIVFEIHHIQYYLLNKQNLFVQACGANFATVRFAFEIISIYNGRKKLKRILQKYKRCIVEYLICSNRKSHSQEISDKRPLSTVRSITKYNVEN